MTQVEKIKKDIQDMETALAMPSINDMPKVKKRLEADLAAAKNQLSALQKKSDPQPYANREPIPQKPELEAWTKQIEREERQKHQDQSESKRAFEQEKRVIASITTAPVITIPAVEIDLNSGKKVMTQVEIINMLKTWFKRVATSKAMEENRPSDAYRSLMGQDTYKLFQGWNTIYNETQEGAAWPPLVDVFPGFTRASQQHKVNAELLWRWASNRA